MQSLLLRCFIVVLLVAGSAGAGVAAAESPPFLFPAGIPNLRGLTPTEVVERLAPLEEQGTHFEVRWVLFRTSHPTYEKLNRRVIAQSASLPRGGKGYVLTLTLALFQGATEGVAALPVGAMPKLVGLTRERAEKMIQSLAARGARFKVRWAGTGEIIQRQSIPPGKILLPGQQTLTLALSISTRPGRPASSKKPRSPRPPAAARPGGGEKSPKKGAALLQAPTASSSVPLAMPPLGGLRRAQVEIVLRSWAEKGVRFKPTWREERLAHPSFGSFDGKVYFQSVRPGTVLSPGEVPLVLHVARYVGVPAGTRAERKRPIPLEPAQTRDARRKGVGISPGAARPPTAKGALASQAAGATPPAERPKEKVPPPRTSAPGGQKPRAGTNALTMPDLLNLERAEAQKRLAELLQLGARLSVEWQDFAVKEARYRRFDGRVFYQSIPPGAPLVAPQPGRPAEASAPGKGAEGPAAGESGQKLVLQVLRYRPPTVPSFVGMDRLGVIRELVRMRREGVRVNPNWVEAPVARSAEHEKVLSQEPKAGNPLPEGDWALTLSFGRWTPELGGGPGSPRVAPLSREGAGPKPGAPAPGVPAGTRGAPPQPGGAKMPTRRAGEAVAKTPAAPKKPGAIGGVVPVLPNFVGMTSQEAYRLARELSRQGAPIEVRWEVGATSDRAQVGRVLRQSVPSGRGLSEPTRVVLLVANRYEPAPPSPPPAGPAPPASKEKAAPVPAKGKMPNLVGLAPREAKRILAGWREKGVQFTVRWAIRPVQKPEQDLRVVEQSIADGAAILSDSPKVILTVGRYRPGLRPAP